MADAKYVRRREGRQAKFCTLACSAASRKGKRYHEPNLTCANCNLRFYRQVSHHAKSKSGLLFCSRACKDGAQHLGIIPPPNFKDGIGIYRSRAIQHYGRRCMRCRYDRCEAALDVHHISRDRTNNDLKNLEVLCRNCHAEEHAAERAAPKNDGGGYRTRTDVSGLQDQSSSR